MKESTLWSFICYECGSKISMTKTEERPTVYCLNCPTLEMGPS